MGKVACIFVKWPSLRELRKVIRQMPRPAYIFLLWLLRLCCLMLLISAALFMRLQEFSGDYHTYLLACAFLENTSGVMLVGLLALAFLLDRLDQM